MVDPDIIQEKDQTWQTDKHNKEHNITRINTHIATKRKGHLGLR